MIITEEGHLPARYIEIREKREYKTRRGVTERGIERAIREQRSGSICS